MVWATRALTCSDTARCNDRATKSLMREENMESPSAPSFCKAVTATDDFDNHSSPAAMMLSMWFAGQTSSSTSRLVRRNFGTAMCFANTIQRSTSSLK